MHTSQVSFDCRWKWQIWVNIVFYYFCLLKFLSIKGRIKHIWIFLLTSGFTTHLSIACTCAFSQAQALYKWESDWETCQCQVRYEEKSIQLYLGFGILFLFSNPWSSVQLYMGMKTVWYKSKRKQINVVFPRYFPSSKLLRPEANF